MSEVGTFPFGWVRDVRGDNWQLIWDPKTKILIAKGASTKEIINLGESPDFRKAKAFADTVVQDPAPYF